MEKEKDKEHDVCLHKLTEELNRLDAQYDDITPPSLQELEWLMADGVAWSQRKARKELMLFWLVSLFLLSLCLTVLSSAPIVYLIAQSIIPIAGLCGLVISRIRRRREGAQE